jgi:ABC-type phosphate transport system substrate-binding protein
MKLKGRIAAVAIGLALNITASCALAEVIAVVGSRSTVTALTRLQVADIFLGKAHRFPNGVEAVPVDLVEGSAARNEFYVAFAEKSPAQIKTHWSKIIFTGRGQPPVAVANGGEMRRRVAANPAAIGYLDRSLLDETLREVLPPAQ